MKDFFFQLIPRRFSSSTFLRHNTVYFLGSMGVSALNYAYYPVISRSLSITQFGEVQFLLSTLLQVTTILTSFGLVILYFTTNSSDDPEHLVAIQALEAVFLYLTIVFWGLLAVFSGPIQQFFHLHYVSTILLFGALLILNVPMIFRSSVLQGLHRFGTSAQVGMSAAATKLVIVIAFSVLGMTLLGIFWGLVIAHLLAVAYAYTVTRKTTPFSWKLSPYKVRLLLGRWQFVSFVVALTSVSAILYGIDVTAVKHYFSPTLAGGYAGVSTASRILFFLTTSIATVLVSSVKTSNTRVQNSQALLRSIVLALVVGAMGFAVLAFSPVTTLSLLVGAKYAPYAYLLRPLCSAVLVISVLNIWLYYYIALKEYASLVLVTGGVAVIGALMVLHHANPMSIILNLGVGGGIILAMLIMYELLKLRSLRHVSLPE